MDVKEILFGITNPASKELIKEFCKISDDFKSGKKSASDCQIPIQTAKHTLQTLLYDMALDISKSRMGHYRKRLD